MWQFEPILRGIRCLERLGAHPDAPAASAGEIARQECLEETAVAEILERLREAGLVETIAEGRFRLARPTAAIRVSEVWAAFGIERPHSGPRITIADLLAWEADAFCSESVARAA